MNAVILGGTGFIGTALARSMMAEGGATVIPTRDPEKSRKRLPADMAAKVTLVPWDGAGGKALAAIMEQAQCDVLVNLLGENIASGRWTQQLKERIVASRVKAGEAVTDALSRLHTRPAVLVQASATGYYGSAQPPTDPLLAAEDAPPGSGFLADTTVRWEASTLEAESMGVRRVVLRTGMVLGTHGGALPRFVTPFRLFAGGPLGSGRQEISWIHIADEVRAIRHLINDSSLHGAFNLTAPDPVTMESFCRQLGTALNRPSWLRTPAWLLETLLGEMAAELITGGRRILPARLLASGFTFRFPTLGQAFDDLFLPRS
ncbi:TIGR01777 family oxidoreductase [Oleidesulfovibrio alaskensis]|uniref:TIGR01777 family oxidoreductase n=1 Tax=Oleidesulfovibrio alaskensis TaxID=58180 RepID=UPI001A3A935D|nr:TIGR01777 family oxidoreductase [Oleidesulfovibrio alaskensis]MBL3581990.1 TIGR01777 family oxidoreductase [Oleidesulfovibrio alaskensis]